jgi:Uma2 family endonuclease
MSTTKAAAISMDEYLRTSYEWEPEWVDGELVERSLPNNKHAEVQAAIDHAVVEAEKRCRLFARPGLRIRVAPDRWRIPDISVFADQKPLGDYPSGVFAAIEIVSPADPAREQNDKLEEYAALGIPHIFVVDPERRRLQKFVNGDLLRVSAIEFTDRGFCLTALEIFT